LRSRRLLLPAALALSGAVAVVTSSVALAASYSASALQFTGDHPLAACGQTLPTAGGVNYPDAEVEPNLAVNPTNPDNVIAVYQQDRWSNGGSNALWTSVTFSGTRSNPKWSAVSAAPSFSRCTGNPSYDRASDPWVTFTPSGHAYQIAITFSETATAFSGPSGVMVSRSDNGGSSWGPATSLIADNSVNILNDKESITANPNIASSDHVYAIWDRLVSPTGTAAAPAGDNAFGYRGPTWFSKTTNGTTWTPATMIYDPGEENQTIGNVVLVTPGNQLVDGFDLLYNFQNSGGVRGLNAAVMRSSDEGSTWTAPTIVDKIVDAPVSVTVNGTSKAVRTGDIIPEWAVDPNNGNLYAVWQDGRWSGGTAQIAFSMSTDGGATWSPTTRINTNTTNPSFTPAIAVAKDGTVGVTYYEMTDAGGTTSYQFVACSANCSSSSSWSAETQVGAAFQMTTAPYAEGYFVGDYEGLIPYATHGFRTAVVEAQPVAAHGPTDPFSNTICPASGC
jgi:hypothetical protein